MQDHTPLRRQQLPTSSSSGSAGGDHEPLPLGAGVFISLIIGKSCTCCTFTEAAPLKTSVFQLPVIIDLRNPTLKARHWAAIEQTVDALLVDIEIPLTLERLSELHVFDFAQEIQDISGQASGEAALEIILKKAS